MILRKNTERIVRNIEGLPFLLTYGQTNADFQKDQSINESSALIWNLLESPISEEELTQKCIEYYECDQSDEGKLLALQITGQVSLYLEELYRRGFIVRLQEMTSIKPSSFGSGATYWDCLEKSKAAATCPPELNYYYQIADLILEITAAELILPSSWDDFRCSPPCAPQTAHIQHIHLNSSYCSVIEHSGSILHSRDLNVAHLPGGYFLEFVSFSDVQHAVISQDGSRAEIFYQAPSQNPAKLAAEAMEAIRFCFMYYSQRNGLIALHSASVLYRNKAWLFSGPSGRGKSTHTNLWKKLYQTPVINGDLNLISFDSNGNPWVHGMPWCGTSGIYTPGRQPLYGITFLEQDDNNFITESGKSDKVLSVFHRLIAPMWFPECVDYNLSHACQIVDTIPICTLHCNMEDQAAETMKTYIDHL